ncbi:Major facilitator superfamily protein [Spironucleus salmonicida]|uniref:Major facilitator superfamily protein n=1 Tax=Spironucleus salmonicida TaxID=348837 RepID=V6LUG7_9EUKA|nr:Major facilitator superfamily protein [Spironucleus salmonicida]|eukprot:EST44454.1 Major facilitator superfamily protein [Spironucleus salmonicida]
MRKPQTLVPHHGTVLAATPFFIFTFIGQFLDSYAIGTALPQIQQELNISLTQAQWILTIFYLANAASAIPLSRLGDKYGYVIVMILLLLLSFVFELTQGFAKNFITLVILRFFTGFFLSGMISNRNAMNRLLPPQDKTLKFLQMYLLIANSIQLLSPFITGVIISFSSWRICIFIASGCYFVSSLLLLLYTNPTDLDRKQKFDILGAFTLVVALTSFCLLFTFIGQQIWIGVGVCSATFIIGLVCFYFVEKKAKFPIFPLYLTKNPVFAIIFTQILIYIVLSGQSYMMPYYIYTKNLSPLTTSFVFTGSSILSVLSSIITPFIQKKVLNRVLLVLLGLVSLSFAIIMIFVLDNFWGFCVCYWLIEFPLQMSLVVLYPLTLFSVPRHLASQVSAIPTTSRTVGMSIAYCVFAMVQQLAVQGSQLSSQVEKEIFSYKMTYVIPIPVLIVSMILVWFRIAISESETNKKGYNEKWLRFLKDIPIQAQAEVEPQHSNVYADESEMLDSHNVTERLQMK